MKLKAKAIPYHLQEHFETKNNPLILALRLEKAQNVEESCIYHKEKTRQQMPFCTREISILAAQKSEHVRQNCSIKS